MKSKDFMHSTRLLNPYCLGLINPLSILYLEIILTMIFVIIFNPLLIREMPR